MKKIVFLVSALVLMTACQKQNPFLTEWDTPYGIPPYDKIKVSDYIPAIKAGIAEQQSEIDSITANPAAPTFENTIVPLEASGAILARVSGVLYNVSETDQSPELDKVVEESIPLMSAHEDNINFNKALYERIAAIHKDMTGLDREQRMVVRKYYEGFVRNGVALPADKQDSLRIINTEIASKTQKIGNNILAESNAFKEKFGFSVSEYPEKMTTTEDRELRRQYNEAYRMRAHNGNENDNSRLVLEVIRLRQQKARMLGYDTHAAYVLENKMAHDAATVDKFLSGIIKASVARANEEIADMQAVMDEDIAAGKLAEGSKIEQWDWWYYAEKVRKAKYALDDDQVRPYFQIDSVVKGIFTAAKELYGVNMRLLDNVPSYNKEVKTYEVTENDGSLIGIFTTDYFPRSSKRGGAWMNNVRDQYFTPDSTEVRPIICNVGNLPGNCNVDDVQTVFHEFGHALHGLLSKCHYRSVSGTNVTRDFVEMFSQFNENWAFQPELLAKYARNAKGEVIPEELVAKINNALKFNQGFMTTELAAASILDMKWHELREIPDSAFADPGKWIDEFEASAKAEMGLIPQIETRYRTTYFNHIFSSGYDAGYYGYLWAEVLDKDAFDIFRRNGVWNHELADSFRKTFLERGGSEEPMRLFELFAGRKPDSRPMLRGRGLIK